MGADAGPDTLKYDISDFTPDWQAELEKMARFGRVEIVDTSKARISLRLAELFVHMVLDCEEVFSRAYPLAEWMKVWARRPEADSQAPTEASDFPRHLSNYASLFQNWFKLKYGMTGGKSWFLDQLQQRAIGWHMENKGRPTDEYIREKLLELKFVRQEDQ